MENLLIENNSSAADAPDDEVQELMKTYDLEQDTAEHVQEIMDEYGLDEDEAVELEELL